MLRAPRFARVFRVLLAALQLTLSGAAVVADGIQEAEGARARVHIESHGSPFRYCACGWAEASHVGGTWHWPERTDG